MPRVYDSASDPHDFCRRHMPPEPVARLLYGDVGDGPDGRGNCFGYDAEHPPYDHNYACDVCGDELTIHDE